MRKMKRRARLSVTSDARRDIVRYRDFLRQQPFSRPMDRIQQVFNAIRHIRLYPEAYPVRRRDPVTGMGFRRYNTGQFAIIYVYWKPSPEFPGGGLVNIRGIRHSSELDLMLRVREAAGA